MYTVMGAHHGASYVGFMLTMISACHGAAYVGVLLSVFGRLLPILCTV